MKISRKYLKLDDNYPSIDAETDSLRASLIYHRADKATLDCPVELFVFRKDNNRSINVTLTLADARRLLRAFGAQAKRWEGEEGSRAES